MDTLIETIKKALLCGIVWALTNLYIKRGLDPMTQEYRSYYVDESMYGGLAVSLNVIILMILNQIL